MKKFTLLMMFALTISNAFSRDDVAPFVDSLACRQKVLNHAEKNGIQALSAIELVDNGEVGVYAFSASVNGKSLQAQATISGPCKIDFITLK